MSTANYQARADASEVEAANAETDRQRQRHEESRKNWQRLTDQAQRFEAEKARLLAIRQDE
ncbi:hypothetical protein GTW51_19245 [Aurantimonas aggregata]|uniref:Uncharacterized protein n=1 Tax=Aurantimonas aggregata TaxID=2047720 RepID=A0A6L9MMA4_9HYPH|nr:hypothetical protein [Aurantimonas aggregata]NDV88832.1 hypothetical protein [Aurantimonas aggregata]